MQKILISVFMTILATGIYAQYNTDDPYYFLYQTAKETYINTTNIDSTDQLFRNAILQDLNFFENNRMWEAGYYYLSSFYPEESESFDAEPSTAMPIRAPA